jgi:cholest-4-en-3-one 26-monooxygenase
MDLGEIDLLDLDRFQRQEHHAMFTALRAQDPIHWTEEPGGSGFWSLARHADLITINRDAEGFSSEAQGTSIADLEGIDAAFDMRGKMMLWTDPPRHTRYRLLVNKGFTPRMIGLLEQHLRYRAELVVDRVIERGECDFVTDLAAELPLQAIAEVMGVPQEERHLLFGWSNRMIGADDPEFASRELYMYAAGLRERRRQDPRDDIVTTLLNAEINGDRLSDEEFEMFILLLAVAGNETTRNATAHGMHALMSNPDEYARLVEDPGVMPLAIEEIVRWATPVMYFRRTAKREITLGGRDISIGDKVVMWHVSANRDETVFEDPFRFDVGRTPKYESRGVVGFGSTVR